MSVITPKLNINRQIKDQYSHLYCLHFSTGPKGEQGQKGADGKILLNF